MKDRGYYSALYVTLFEVSSQDTDPPLKMKVTSEAMKKILNDFSQDTVELLKADSEEKHAQEIESEAGRQSDIAKALNRMFSSLPEGYLIPKESYDLIIDTYTFSENDVVEMIQKGFLRWKTL